MRRLRFATAAALLFVIQLGLNAPTWDYGFVYDDHAVILERQPFWQQGWTTFLTTRQWGTGRHVLALSMDLNRTTPPTATPFHLVNTVLAGLVTVLVFALGATLGVSWPAAWTGALLFAVHPVHADAVVSIVGRAELLAALGVLGCVLLHARNYPMPALSIPFATILFVIALGSKESALALFAVLCLYDLVLGRPADHPLRRWLPYVAYAAVAAACYSLVSPHLGELEPIAYVDNPLASLPPLERAMKACAVLWQYVGVTLFPVALKTDRSYATTDPSYASAVVGTVAWVSIALSCWWMRGRAPRAVFATAWFPAAFAVTANIAFPIGTIMAERLVYLPSVGLALLVALALEAAWRHGRLTRAVTVSAAAAATLVLAFAYDARGRVWTSDAQYHRVATFDSPHSAKAHYDRGLFLAREQDFDGAGGEFRQALKIYPAFSRAAYYLASTYLLQSRPEDALQVYEAYVKVDPNDIGILSQLTTVQLALDRYDDAHKTAERLVTLDPDNIDHRNLLVLVETLTQEHVNKLFNP
jgi:tetratricopeptide (TPR) repeat protein